MAMLGINVLIAVPEDIRSDSESLQQWIYQPAETQS